MTEELIYDPWCLTLPEDMVDARDFKAEEAIRLDMNVKLPTFFSLGKWVYKTNYQWAIWSCTSNSTSHWVQVLNVKEWGELPKWRNIITPDWKDLWTKMGHNPSIYEGWDYVERAVSTALKEGIATEEGGEAKFDGYATDNWSYDDKSIEKIKRYIYAGCPVIWTIRGDKNTWRELSAGELKTVPENPTGGHAVAVVGFDEWGLWFLNSRMPNDDDKLKSRFYVKNEVLKKMKGKMNYRYRVLYIKEKANKDPEYLKRKNNAVLVLSALKKMYPEENNEVKRGIEVLSTAMRKTYPEINTELPL